MNFFEVTENGINTILKLKDNYDMILKEDGTIKITPKIISISDPTQLSNYAFTFSNILECEIDGTIISSPNYSKVLEHIYSVINDGIKIIQTPSTFHLKTVEYNKEGFEYLPIVGISYQRKDANGTIKEILIQAKHHNIPIDIMIKLNDDTLVCILNTI
jgi:hypothetical protein